MLNCPKCQSELLKGAEEDGIEIVFCPNCNQIVNMKDFKKPVTSKENKKGLDRIFG